MGGPSDLYGKKSEKMNKSNYYQHLKGRSMSNNQIPKIQMNFKEVSPNKDQKSN
jgi:hypothetical protein